MEHSIKITLCTFFKMNNHINADQDKFLKMIFFCRIWRMTQGSSKLWGPAMGDARHPQPCGLEQLLVARET